MKIATWNLNHRAGSRFTRFFPEAAAAIGSLAVDVLVLTEYFPKDEDETFSKDRHETFLDDLDDHGFSYAMLSPVTGEKANRVLIAAKQPFELAHLPVPAFDQQFPANVLAVRFPSTGIRLLGLRIPYYTGKDLPRVLDAWAWLESAAEALKGDQAVIIGDLNVELASHAQRGGNHFRRILASWIRAKPPSGVSYYGKKGARTEIDHALCSPSLQFASATYQTEFSGAVFAGTDAALSDHAVLMVEVVPAQQNGTSV